jgi:hypothetical protein
MLPRRTTDTDGDNLAMAVDNGSYHQRTSVSDTTVDLRRMCSDGTAHPGRTGDGSDHHRQRRANCAEALRQRGRRVSWVPCALNFGRCRSGTTCCLRRSWCEQPRPGRRPTRQRAGRGGSSRRRAWPGSVGSLGIVRHYGGSLFGCGRSCPPTRT